MANKIIWDLIKQRNFKEAYRLADEEYLQNKNEQALANRAIASLNLKQYKNALDDFLEIIRLTRGEADLDYLLAGVCYWILGNTMEAISIWKEGLNTPYTDAAGGVEVPAMLFYAAVSLQDKNLEKEAIRLLKKKWKTKRVVNWPGAIAGYLLGQINEEDVIRSVSTQPTLRIREMCQVQFYFAVTCLKNGDQQGFLTHLEQCKSSEYGYLEQEYYLAIGELDKYKLN